MIYKKENKKKLRMQLAQFDFKCLLSSEQTTYLFNACCYSFICHLFSLKKIYSNVKVTNPNVRQTCWKRKNRNKTKKKEEERKSAKYGDDDDVTMSSFFLSAYYFFSCLYRTFVTLADCIRFS